jgi:hypothetical protein
LPEDSDDWLNVNADDFDALLNNKMQTRPNEQPEKADSEEAEITNEQATRLKKLAQKVEAFVEGEGDIEGARFDEYGILSLIYVPELK